MAFDQTPINVKDATGTSKPMIAYNDGTNNAFAHAVVDNTGYGVYINTATTGLCMNDNYIYDSGGATQTYGLVVDTVSVSSALLATNHLNSNATGAVNLLNSGTLTGSIASNYGYTP